MGMFQNALGNIMSGTSKMLNGYRDLQRKREIKEQLEISNEIKARETEAKNERLAQREKRMDEMAAAKVNYYQARAKELQAAATERNAKRRRDKKLNDAKVADLKSKTEKRDLLSEKHRRELEKAVASTPEVNEVQNPDIEVIPPKAIESLQNKVDVKNGKNSKKKKKSAKYKLVVHKATEHLRQKVAEKENGNKIGGKD